MPKLELLAAYIVFDWLQIAGSWQLGVQDNSPGEFENEGPLPDDFYVTDPNLKNMERAITHSDRRVTMNFSLTQLLAAEYDFTYTTRVIQQGGVNPPHPFSIEVNGTTVKSYEPLPDNTIVSVKIPPGILTDGPNTISVVFTVGATEGWLQFDFHRLEVSIRPPAGTLILIQ
jgi:hypothetical protein